MKKKLSSADDHEANMLFWFKMQATVNYKSYLDTKMQLKSLQKCTSTYLHLEFYTMNSYLPTQVLQ